MTSATTLLVVVAGVMQITGIASQQCIDSGCHQSDVDAAAVVHLQVNMNIVKAHRAEDITEYQEMAVMAGMIYGPKSKNGIFANCSAEAEQPCCRSYETTQDAEVEYSCGKWTMTKGDLIEVRSGLLPGTDKAGLFKNGDKCAVVFSGTDDVQDVWQDILAFPYDFCGYKVHGSFAKELEQFKSSSKWTGLLANLQGCSQVYSVGHSLGGAVASLFAGCSGTEADGWESTKSVDKLYTFGAPGVSFDLTPKSPKGECFGGRRFFNTDICANSNDKWCRVWYQKVDFVPKVTAHLNMLHPAVDVDVLERQWSWNKKYKATLPSSIAPNNELTCGASIAAASPQYTWGTMALHNMGNYIDRLRALDA
jgi:hypothetical protein